MERAASGLRTVESLSRIRFVKEVLGGEPKVADWKSWRRGDPDPYTPEAFTENAAKRIVLCEA